MDDGRLTYKGVGDMTTVRLNKSNSTTNAVQVKANLQEQLNDHLHFRKLKCCQKVRHLESFHIFALALTMRKIFKFHTVTFKKRVKVIRCKSRYGIIRWQKSKSVRVVLCIFAPALTVSEM